MSSKMVLIVDDDADLRDNLEDILNDTGYAPCPAANCSEANKVMEGQRPSVAILDLKLPDGTGTGLLGDLQRINPDCLGIIVTAYADLDSALEALEGRAFHYLQKPVRPVELLGLLKRAFETIKLKEEKRRAETELRESEARYRTLVERINEMVLMQDRDHNLTYLSPQCERITGFKPEEAVGLKWTSFATDNPINKAAYQKGERILQSGEDPGQPSMIEVKTKDGESILLEVNQCPLKDTEGNVIGTVGSARDVTMQKKMQDALRESKEYLNSILNCIADPICVKDGHHRWVLVNDKFCEIAGASREELLGKSDYDFFPSEEADVFWEMDEEVFRTEKENFNEEYLTNSSTGDTISLNTKKSLYENQEGKRFIVAVGRDVTAHKEAEEEKEKLESQLQQAQKMQAIGTLAGGIAHDFNNILGSIVAYTELGLYSLSEETQTYRNLQQVLKACDRAKDSVKQILAFSRRHEQETRPISVRVIVKESIKLLRASLPSSIKIRQNIRSVSDTVMADQTQIHQVMMNLCTNAAHAMQEEGGTLTVSMGDQLIDADSVSRYPNLSPGRYVELTVRDTGQGIEREIMDRIFEPYFTTKEKGVGTGLGLAVVHGIVANHGGSITVESKPGKGSSFQVLLPAVERARIEDVASREPLPTGDERVLLVDDEETLADAGEQMLRRLGYTVVSTTSSLEALKVFRAKPEDFDLIITDMTMPDMTGDKLAKDVMNIRFDIPIILCTGYSERISEEKAKEMGINDFIMKPYVMRDLATAIRKVIDGG